MNELLGIAGGIAAVAQFGYQLYRDRKSDAAWDVHDRPVEADFPQIALDAGLLPAGDYRWMREEKLFGAELAGTHELVLIEDEGVRVLVRPVYGANNRDPSVLVRRLEAM